MKPNNIETLFIAGSDEQNRRLLFQCALNWAENGANILYITKSPIDSLLNPIEATLPDKETFKRIIFRYLPTTQDILKQCMDIHKYATIPHIIIVEYLDYYCNLSASDIQHSAMVCSMLLDAAGNTSNSKRILLASCKLDTESEYVRKMKLIIDLYFWENVWFLKPDTNEVDLKTVYDELKKHLVK